MSATATLADWTAHSPKHHTPRAAGLAREALQDVVGCMIAGSVDEASRRVLAGCLRWGQGGATVVGSRTMLAAPWAALVNGTSAHALDYDDTFLPLKGHASAVLAAALLPLAEEEGAGGAELIDAYIVGLEVLARIGEGVNRAHYDRGWHATATLGVIGAAAACARLLGADAAQAAAAISLATSNSGGFKGQNGTMAKPMHAGLAAQRGMIAAGLAMSGVTGAAEPLEGPWRFRELFAGDGSAGFGEAVAKLGTVLAIEEYGLSLKPYPCCASAHLTLDAIADLVRDHGFAAADVLELSAVLPSGNARNMMYPDPRTEMEARFSLEYCAAVMLLDGRVTLADFRTGAVARPRVRQTMARVRMSAHPARAADRPADVPATRTCVLLRDGSWLEDERSAPYGSLARPMPADARSAKFRECAAFAVPDDDAVAAEAMLGELERVRDVRALTARLRPPGAARGAAAE